MEIQNETNRYIWVDNKKSFIRSMHILSPNYLLVIGDIKMNMITVLLPRGLRQSGGARMCKRESTPKYFVNYDGNVCREREKTFQFCHNKLHRKSVFLKALCYQGKQIIFSLGLILLLNSFIFF